MNDDMRRLWVLNDEGLNNLFRTSGMDIRAWVAENRNLIDDAVEELRAAAKLDRAGA